MLDPGLAVSVVAAGLLGIHSNDARVAGKRKEADAVNVANKTKWGSPWLRAVVDGKTNHALEVAIKWWFGMDVSFGSCCPYCPNHRLDPLGHHALTCKHGGDVVLHHNSLRDVFVESCHRACLGGQVEVGSGLGLDRLHSRPADVLVNNWHLGKPAAFDSLSLHRLTQSL
ncbi:hypothetical protein EMCRGX_G014049 [Ephydatia muelleri]